MGARYPGHTLPAPSDGVAVPYWLYARWAGKSGAPGTATGGHHEIQEPGMPCTNLTVSTDDGACPATLHTPAGSGSWPAVILYTDAGGVRETFLAMADRLAGLGYAVLLPDVYYRVSEFLPFDFATVFDDPPERERLMSLVKSLTRDVIVRDAGAFLEFLAGRPEVSGTKVGTTGYCMGGRISLIVAGHYPDRVAAAASFHGGHLAAANDPDSPALLADRFRATIYVAAATNDPPSHPSNTNGWNRHSPPPG